RGDVDRRTDAGWERVGDRCREQHDLDRETGHGQPRPMELPMREPLDAPAGEQPDEDPDRYRDEDEHSRPASAPRDEDVVQLADVVLGVTGDEPIEDR